MARRALTFRGVGRGVTPLSRLLPQRLPSTPWDPELARAMAGEVCVEEEELPDMLLADLETE